MILREKLICAGLAIGATGAAAVTYQVSAAVAEYRADQQKTAPAIAATAANVAQVTGVLADCHVYAASCIESTAADLRAAADQLREAAARVPGTADKINGAADQIAGLLQETKATIAAAHQVVDQAAPNVATVTGGAAQLAGLLLDCKTSPHTCIQPRVAGTMRAAELLTGHAMKITAEGERIARPTADAIEHTTEHADTITDAAAKHAEPIAANMEAISKDGRTIIHRMASPITYVLGLLRTVAKKFLPFIP
jgi:hypothetical protein